MCDIWITRVWVLFNKLLSFSVHARYVGWSRGMLILADTRMTLISLTYASGNDIQLLRMQLILCSSCWEHLVHFAFWKFHLGFCSDLISVMLSTACVTVCMCRMCWKAFRTCTYVCRGWPLYDMTQHRSGEYSRFQHRLLLHQHVYIYIYIIIVLFLNVLYRATL